MFRLLRPALVHFNDPCVSGILGARLSGLRTLTMTHHTPELWRQYNWRGRLLERLAMRSLTHVIFTSERDQQTGKIRDGIPVGRSSVVYHGLSLSDFSNALRNERTAVRDELGIDPQTRVVITVGRLVPQKRHSDLIVSAQQIAPRHPDVVFLIAGEGELRMELQHQISAAGLERRVRLLGHRTDVPRLLAASDVFALPSAFEGGCYAVLEAMAAGLPVIATDVGGIAEAVHHGLAGLLVPVADTDTLTAAIQSVLRSPEIGRRFGEEGRRRIAANFTVDRMVHEVFEIYRRLGGLPVSA
jgi:glycosyltransferase involved in cell wall biosynthesis